MGSGRIMAIDIGASLPFTVLFDSTEVTTFSAKSVHKLHLVPTEVQSSVKAKERIAGRLRRHSIGIMAANRFRNGLRERHNADEQVKNNCDPACHCIVQQPTLCLSVRPVGSESTFGINADQYIVAAAIPRRSTCSWCI